MADAHNRPREGDEDYDEEADEDFNPEVAAQDENLSSSEDDTLSQNAQPAKQKRKRTHDDEIDAKLDSGDEATIKGRRKRQKKGDLTDDEGGEGGFIKTRSQRRQELLDRGPLATTKGATVDVDFLWAKLSSQPVGRPPEFIRTADGPPKQQAPQEELVTIRRTTKFAGEVTTEVRQVLKSSKEAQLYLEEQEVKKKREDGEPQANENSVQQPAGNSANLPVRRPLKRPSRFDPNPVGEVRALPSHLQLKWPRNKQALSSQNENILADAPQVQMPPPKLPATAKLNVVEKSRYDWAGYVDKAGIAEELDEHGKSKKSYLARTEFLNRTEDRREADRREARMRLS